MRRMILLFSSFIVEAKRTTETSALHGIVVGVPPRVNPTLDVDIDPSTQVLFKHFTVVREEILVCTTKTGITAESVRPGDLQVEVIKWAFVEMETCRNIFGFWDQELLRCLTYWLCGQMFANFPRNTRFRSCKQQLFEMDIMDRVHELRDDADGALRSSELILTNYQAFARIMDRRLRKLSHTGGGELYPIENLDHVGAELQNHSDAISQHVGGMQGNLFDLVDILETTWCDTEKRALHAKIWNWMEHIFRVMAGGAISTFATLVRTVSAAVMIDLVPVTSAVAKICKQMEVGMSKFAHFK